MKISKIFITLLLAISSVSVFGQTIELLPYGDFNNWVTREIKESRIIGGKQKHCYAVFTYISLVGVVG